MYTTENLNTDIYKLRYSKYSELHTGFRTYIEKFWNTTFYTVMKSSRAQSVFTLTPYGNYDDLEYAFMSAAVNVLVTGTNERLWSTVLFSELMKIKAIRDQQDNVKLYLKQMRDLVDVIDAARESTEYSAISRVAYVYAYVVNNKLFAFNTELAARLIALECCLLFDSKLIVFDISTEFNVELSNALRDTRNNDFSKLVRLFERRTRDFWYQY